MRQVWCATKKIRSRIIGNDQRAGTLASYRSATWNYSRPNRSHSQCDQFAQNEKILSPRRGWSATRAQGKQSLPLANLASSHEKGLRMGKHRFLYSRLRWVTSLFDVRPDRVGWLHHIAMFACHSYRKYLIDYNFYYQDGDNVAEVFPLHIWSRKAPRKTFSDKLHGPEWRKSWGGGGFRLKPHIEVRFKWMWRDGGCLSKRKERQNGV